MVASGEQEVESWESIGRWDRPRATVWKTRKSIVYEWLLAFGEGIVPLHSHMQAKSGDDSGVGDQAAQRAQQMDRDLIESLLTQWYAVCVVGQHDIALATLLWWRAPDLQKVRR